MNQTEGLNIKIKMLKRQTYGYRDMKYFKLRSYHLQIEGTEYPNEPFQSKLALIKWGKRTALINLISSFLMINCVPKVFPWFKEW